MPSIRKKTSNRLKIHDRERLKKKVKDNKKKQAKKAKKNPQWKSKNKDPGIPGEFPYKDQVLAEVAEGRRLAAEEKERKAEERRLARLKAKGIEPEANINDEDADAEGEDDVAETSGKKDLNVGADAIADLGAKVLTGEMKKRPQPTPAVEEEDEEEEGEPALVNRDLTTMQAVLDEADVVLEVVDARDPLEFRSVRLEAAAKQKGVKFAVVLNKIDLCPRESVAAWVAHLRPQYPTFVFKSSSAFLSSCPSTTPALSGKGKSKIPVGDAQGVDSLMGYLSHLAKAKKGEAPLTVVVTGVTNVGKSALINSLAKRAALPVYELSSTSRGATTTDLPQEVTLESTSGKQIRVVDTPGLAFEIDAEAEDKDVARGRDILMRSRGRIDKLKDPSPPVSYLVSRANNEDLMLLYNLAAFAKNDPTAFLSGVARSNQLIKKKGDLDLVGASRIVLRDWSIGKLSHYAAPPKPATSPEPEPLTLSGRVKARSPKKDVAPPKWLAALYAANDEVVERLKARKEMRKESVGLVKMTSGEVDGREVKWTEEWAALQEDEESEEEDDEGMEVEGEEGEAFIGEDDVEEEVEFDEDEEVRESDDEDEEVEEEVAVPEPKKRKRGAAAPAKSKKVAFAAVTKGKSSKSTPSELSPSKAKKATGPSSILKTKASAEVNTEEAEPARPAKKLKKAAEVKPAPLKKVANVVAGAKKVKEAKEGKEAGKEGGEAYNFAAFF